MTTIEERAIYAKLEAMKDIRSKTIQLEKLKVRIIREVEVCDTEEKFLAEYRREMEMLLQEKMSHVEELRQIHADINSMETLLKQAEENRSRAFNMANRMHEDYVPLKTEIDQMRRECLGLNPIPDLHEEEGSIIAQDRFQTRQSAFYHHASGKIGAIGGQHSIIQSSNFIRPQSLHSMMPPEATITSGSSVVAVAAAAAAAASQQQQQHHHHQLQQQQHQQQQHQQQQQQQQQHNSGGFLQPAPPPPPPSSSSQQQSSQSASQISTLRMNSKPPDMGPNRLQTSSISMGHPTFRSEFNVNLRQQPPPMKSCLSCHQQIHRNAPICPLCKAKSRSRNPKKPKKK